MKIKDVYWYTIGSIEDVVWLMGTNRINKELKEEWGELLCTGQLDLVLYREVAQEIYWNY